METEKVISDVGLLKRRLNHELESVKVMLVHKKRLSSHEEWMQFVEATRKSILIHPDQYLEKEFPTGKILETIINKIFDDFLNACRQIHSPASDSNTSL